MLLVSETVYFEELQTTHGTFTFHVYEFADGRRTLEIACQAPNNGFVDILVIPNEDLEEFHRAYCRAAQAVRRELLACLGNARTVSERVLPLDRQGEPAAAGIACEQDQPPRDRSSDGAITSRDQWPTVKAGN